ncbi:hypothetical protein C8R44DRAFT_354584 [Mycena epipterygia]|nr:hypothetical protein C8R44DRAFT_354584 [Mycena epipterygia]
MSSVLPFCLLELPRARPGPRLRPAAASMISALFPCHDDHADHDQPISVPTLATTTSRVLPTTRTPLASMVYGARHTMRDMQHPLSFALGSTTTTMPPRFPGCDSSFALDPDARRMTGTTTTMTRIRARVLRYLCPASASEVPSPLSGLASGTVLPASHARLYLTLSTASPRSQCTAATTQTSAICMGVLKPALDEVTNEASAHAWIGRTAHTGRTAPGRRRTLYNSFVGALNLFVGAQRPQINGHIHRYICAFALRARRADSLAAADAWFSADLHLYFSFLNGSTTSFFVVEWEC